MVRGPRAAVKVSNGAVKAARSGFTGRRGAVSCAVRPPSGGSAVPTDAPCPEPVPGRSFESSPGKGLGQLFTGLFFVALGGLIVAWRLSGFVLGNRRPSWVITIAAGFCVLMGGFFAVTAVAQMLRKRRVVVGADRVQVLERAGGAEVVVAQVPYANVVGIGVESTDTGPHVNVALADRAAEGTFDSAGLVRAWLNGEGHSLMLENHYRGTPQELATAIDDAALEWRQARDEADEAATPPGA